MNTAQKVRLWFAGSTQALALILGLIIAGSFNYSPVLDVTATGGDVLGLLVFVVVLEVAATVLASISLWRFVHPIAKPVEAS